MGRKRAAGGSGGSKGEEGLVPEGAEPATSAGTASSSSGGGPGCQTPDGGAGGVAQLLNNPLLAAAVLTNPVLAMAMASMKQKEQTFGAVRLASEAPSVALNPDVEELCEHFNIEDRVAKRLDEAMKHRQDTFAADLTRLWGVLPTARCPSGLLMVKVKEMENGSFVGVQQLDDDDFRNLVKRFRLDESAQRKLADILARRGETRKDDIKQLEKHFERSTRPSSMAMMMLGRFRDGERIPDPDPKWEPCAMWSKDGEGRRERRSRSRSRDRDRRRSRSRDRDRRRSRSRGRDRRGSRSRDRR